MKRSWRFLIARQYNYQFENFYAVVIQQAYKNYKKRPESLAKQVWEAVRNDGTPDDKKFLDIVPRGKTYHFINGKLIESNYVSDRGLHLQLGTRKPGPGLSSDLGLAR